MKNINIIDLINILRSKNYTVFEDDSKNYNLNIVGIRAANKRPEHFDDLICTFWHYNQDWNLIKMKCTTDPGIYYLNHPMYDHKGTAIVKEGQYKKLWKYGKHNGYVALQQINPVVVYRDINHDDNLDMIEGSEERGNFKINLHRANPNRQSFNVNRWSAGCQVIADPDDFQHLLAICRLAKKNWGDGFSYTLINEKDLG